MSSSWPLIVVIALSVVTVEVAPASTATVARDAQKVLDRLIRPDGPGAAVLIARGEEVIVRSARGRAEIELDVPLSLDHTFRIASVTKVFIAASILKLAEAGQLSLDDALARYFPDMPDAGRITLRQLLNHTAGISDRASQAQAGTARRESERAARLADILKRPLNFAPGTSWSYSNAGYILLGAVIEIVTGEPWHAVLEKQFFQPLRMMHTRYGDMSVLIPGRAAGYTTDSPGREVRRVESVSATVPDSAGALVSTADDLLGWMRALASGRAIGRESFRQMITPVQTPSPSPASERYGLGVYLWQVRGETMIGHTGQIPGFVAVVGYLPQHDITIIALANDDSFDARLVARRLAAIALGQPYQEVVRAKASQQELQELEGSYRIDEQTVRRLLVKDGTLYTQRGDRNPIRLQLTADRSLHFDPDEISYFVPVRDGAGRIVGLDYYQDGEGPPQRLPRIN
jgi:CubicO group peptidase (beta-lactamase class C family)